MSDFIDCILWWLIRSILSWMETHQVIVAVFVAVIGWVITHWFTLQAQNKNLKNVIINDARLDITKAIRDYQDWLIQVDTSIAILPALLKMEKEKIMEVKWLNEWEKLNGLIASGKAAVNWIYRLEEYDSLFPSLRDCRIALGNRNLQIQDMIKDLSSSLLKDKANERDEAITKASDNTPFIIDQLVLMVDLLAILQDISLGAITGNKVPERKPEDPNAVRLIKGENGKIEIYDPKSKSASNLNQK